LWCDLILRAMRACGVVCNAREVVSRRGWREKKLEGVGGLRWEGADVWGRLRD
jgi:hypothetical protein